MNTKVNSSSDLKELTKAEEEVMQVLWKIEKGFVNDILEHFDIPKPAYNTISTIVRILEKKGFVGHKAFGKTHEYYPLISKAEYTNLFMKNVIQGYFDNSFKKVVSFFSGNDSLSIKEMEEIRNLIDLQIEQKKHSNHD